MYKATHRTQDKQSHKVKQPSKRMLCPSAAALTIALVLDQQVFSSPAFSEDIFLFGTEELSSGSHADLPSRNKDDISSLYKVITKQILPRMEKNLRKDHNNNKRTTENIEAVKNYLDKKIEASVTNVEQTLS